MFNKCYYCKQILKNKSEEDLKLIKHHIAKNLPIE